MKLNFLNQLANLFLVDCIEINIGCILLCRALHFAHREVLLYTSRECHYVGEFVTSPSQCAEKKNAPNTLLYKLTVYYIRDFPNIERMPQRINNCKRNRFLYFFLMMCEIRVYFLLLHLHRFPDKAVLHLH